MKKIKLPTGFKTIKKLCLRCGKKTFVNGKGCPCGFRGANYRVVSRDEVKNQLKPGRKQ